MIIITRFGAQWSEIGRILKDHWHILTRCSALQEVVCSRPYLVAKKASNLSNVLVHSEFSRSHNMNWLTDLPALRGMYPCGQCVICKHRSDVFSDSGGKNQYSIKQFINRATTRVLYILECPCKKIYVGKTKCQLRIGIEEHIKSII